jgi:TrmH family RNA methyltransferase
MTNSISPIPLSRGECRIVLMRPRDPNNIGAAARAMKNFGLTDLAVVSPHPPVWEEVVSAVGALDLLTGATVVHTLAEALADRTLVIGTLDPTRIESRQLVETPAQLFAEPERSAERVALVFGPEKHGLTNEDLSHCHRWMSIPTQPHCPSMNLGQAVAICCYEWSRYSTPRSIDLSETPSTPSTPSTPAPQATIEVLLQRVILLLEEVEFLQPANGPAMTRRLRRALLRHRLTREEAEQLCAVLARTLRKLATDPPETFPEV